MLAATLRDVKTIMQIEVTERIEVESSEVPMKKLNSEESLENWTFTTDDNICPNCSKKYKWKKTAQGGWRILTKCDMCKLIMKICKERIRTYRPAMNGSADNIKFVETWSNKELKMHTLYQSVCILFNLLNGGEHKELHQAGEMLAMPDNESNADDDFQIFKHKRSKNKTSILPNLSKIKLLPGRVVGYSGVLDQLARWKIIDHFELNILKLGGNIFISNSSKYRLNIESRDKLYDLVTSTIGGIEVCAIAEIDERIDGLPRELKEFMKSKREGHLMDIILSVAIKMTLGNIQPLKITYEDTEASSISQHSDGVFTSDSTDDINIASELSGSLEELGKSLRAIVKAVDGDHHMFYKIIAGQNHGFRVEPIDHSFNIKNFLPDFQSIVTDLSNSESQAK